MVKVTLWVSKRSGVQTSVIFLTFCFVEFIWARWVIMEKLDSCVSSPTHELPRSLPTIIWLCYCATVAFPRAQDSIIPPSKCKNTCSFVSFVSFVLYTPGIAKWCTEQSQVVEERLLHLCVLSEFHVWYLLINMHEALSHQHWPLKCRKPRWRPSAVI